MYSGALHVLAMFTVDIMSFTSKHYLFAYCHIASNINLPKNIEIVINRMHIDQYHSG